MSRAFTLPDMSALPALSDVPPVTEGVNASPGAASKASRDDHVHRRLTSVTAHTTNGVGEATVVFTRTYNKEPGIFCTAKENVDGGALTYKARSFSTDGNGQVTGCVIKFYRIQPLPAVLTLLTALLNFRVDAGTVGTLPFICTAVERSD